MAFVVQIYLERLCKVVVVTITLVHRACKVVVVVTITLCIFKEIVDRNNTNSNYAKGDFLNLWLKGFTLFRILFWGCISSSCPEKFQYEINIHIYTKWNR